MVKLIKWTEKTTKEQIVTLFPKLKIDYNFHGRHLTVLANNGGLFAHLVQLPDGSTKAISGIDLEICDILANKFNFS